MDMMLEIDWYYTTLQFDLAKAQYYYKFLTNFNYI